MGARSEASYRGSAPPKLTSDRVALPILLLVAQVTPKRKVLGFIRINILTKRFMAFEQLCRNLLRTPLHAQQRSGFFSYHRLNGWCIKTELRTLRRERTGLFGSIAPRNCVAIQLSAKS